MNCAHCGNPLKKGEKFCGNCGTSANTPRFCNQCGRLLEGNTSVCKYCLDKASEIVYSNNDVGESQVEIENIGESLPQESEKNRTLQNEKILFCGNCGTKLYDGAQFCGNCGQSIHELPEMVQLGESTIKGHKTQSNKIRLFIIIGLSVVLLLLVGFVVYLLMMDSNNATYVQETMMFTEAPNSQENVLAEENQSFSDDNVTDDILLAAQSTPMYQSATMAPSPPDFRLGAYSSEHADSSDGISSDTYYASHLVDGDFRTAWIPVCEDDGLTPIGHWIELVADVPQTVNGLTFVNGFAKDDRKYYNNFRVKDIKIIINGTDEIDAKLSDLGCGVTEYISFGKTYQAQSIRIIIQSVHETAPTYKEAAISEIIPEL